MMKKGEVKNPRENKTIINLQIIITI